MRKTQLILLVDDDADIRQAMREILEYEGYSAEESRHGAEALEALGRLGHDCLILLDLTMPVMGGEEFLERLRQTPGGAALPVIVISADRNIEQKVERWGVACIIRKPFELLELLEAVAQHCEPRR